MKRIKSILMMGLCALLLGSCGGGADKTITLKLAHGLPPTHSVHLGMVYMRDQLRELSSGKMDINIYESAQLGSEVQCVELLQVGSLDITKVSSLTLESFVDEFQVFGIPYMFHSKEHYLSVMNSEVGQKILESTVPYWFRGITYFDAGARSFYTVDKPIRTPEDLHGLKIRTMKSPIAVEMMQSFGGSATPVDWGELYTALQSGVVDGAENNTPSIATAFHHEVSKYYSENEHTMCPDVVIISEVTWQKLNEQQRGWLKEAARRARIYQEKLWVEQEKSSLEIMIKAGVEVIRPDKTPFIKAAQPMIDRFKADPRFTDIIQTIANIGDSLKTDGSDEK